MKRSSNDEVAGLYAATADSCSAMMDAEIDAPIYADTFGRLCQRLENLTGLLVDVDTSCGSGHMHALYAGHLDSQRQLAGIDLTPQTPALIATIIWSIAK